MGSVQQNKLFKSFVRGLITEASPLNYPEDASTDELNFVLNRDGTRSRRLGVSAEAGFTTYTEATYSEEFFLNSTIRSFTWQAAANNGVYNFLVVQVGNKLHFYTLGLDSISNNKRPEIIDLQNFNVTSEDPSDYECQFASGKGKLFVASKVLDPFYVEYDILTDTLTATRYDVQIRDTIGLDDGLRVDERPETNIKEHRYNLWNQGWYPNSVAGPGGGPTVPDFSYFTSEGVWPSNSMIAYYGKITSSSSPEAIGTWSAVTQNKTNLGNTEAPKGHYILNLFERDRTAVVRTSFADAGLPVASFGNPKELEPYRPTTVSFFAGRVWLAGIESSIFSNTIFYSQILESDANIGRCYQEADPTSEFISDLVDTDGGTIQIPEIGTIYKLIPVGEQLVVFADNGLWAIKGNSGSGFKATDFAIDFISPIGTLGPNNIVIAEGIPFYWATGGIYTIQSNEITSKLGAVSITQDTIQSFYLNNIPSDKKQNAKGIYDSDNKKIYWYYNANCTALVEATRCRFTGVLVLDLSLQAFYPFRIATGPINSSYIAEVITLPSRDRTLLEEPIQTSTGEAVTISSGEPVIVSFIRDSSSRSGLKLLLVDISNNGITFGDYTNRTFVDFENLDSLGAGYNYTSYLDTAYLIEEDVMRSKQIAYITVIMEKTEDNFITSGTSIVPDFESSCFLRAKWDWHTTASGNRWSSPRQVYRHLRNFVPNNAVTPYDDGRQLVVTKNRIRGQGKAIQLRFESEQGKDLKLVGWMLNMEGRTNV